MRAFDFEAVTFNSSVFCVPCLPEGVSVEGDGVFPIFANSEWDAYPVCDVCRSEHDYVLLTAAGGIWKRERKWSEKMRDFSQRCRDHSLALPSCTPFGSYTLIYVDRAGEEHCGKCANNVDLELELDSFGTYDEGPTLECASCGDEIESSYGEVENEDPPSL